MPHAPDLAGRVLDDRYELHALLGEGTFGRVYRGLDRRLARAVAVKVIKPWWSDDPAWVERFEREAQLLARVNDPGIVQIFDVGHAPEGLYYVAELIDGQSLAERLRSGALTPGEAARIGERLARALAHAHEQRVVHRDVKPANILLTADGRVKVSDFGVARLAEGSSHGAGATAIGTPRYMAPEQARGRETTPASDVYGVGVVLYEMLAGQPPFRGEAAVDVAVRHLQDPPPPLPAHVPPALAAVVLRALAKDPADRYPDGGALADALGAAVPGAAGAPLPLPGLEPGTLEAPTQVASASEAATRIVVPAQADAATRVVPADAAATQVVGEGEAATAIAPGSGSAAAASATAAADRDAGATRVARRRPAPPPPRRPAARKRRRRWLLGGLGVLAALIATSLIVHGARTTVPQVVGLHRGGVAARASRADLHARFDRRWSDRAAGVAIAQSPSAGSRAAKGSDLRVTLSAGPKPVAVPRVTGLTLDAARSALGSRKLLARVTEVASPGTAAGVVVQQSPAPPAQAVPGSTIALSVAAAPQWRTVTTFAGTDAGSSVAFRIRGSRWRVVYRMAYAGRCTLLLVCFGPKAHARTAPGGDEVDSWSLDRGAGKVRTVESGPGVYQVEVTPGDDAARWSMEVQDFS